MKYYQIHFRKKGGNKWEFLSAFSTPNMETAQERLLSYVELNPEYDFKIVEV